VSYQGEPKDDEDSNEVEEVRVKEEAAEDGNKEDLEEEEEEEDRKPAAKKKRGRPRGSSSAKTSPKKKKRAADGSSPKTSKNEQEETTTCPKCNKKFTSKLGAAYHIDNFVCQPDKAEHKPKKIRKKRSKTGEGGKYKKFRGAEKDRTCPTCHRVFTSVNGLNYHMGACTRVIILIMMYVCFYTF